MHGVWRAFYIVKFIFFMKTKSVFAVAIAVVLGLTGCTSKSSKSNSETDTLAVDTVDTLAVDALVVEAVDEVNEFEGAKSKFTSNGITYYLMPKGKVKTGKSAYDGEWYDDSDINPMESLRMVRVSDPGSAEKLFMIYDGYAYLIGEGTDYGTVELFDLDNMVVNFGDYGNVDLSSASKSKVTKL